MGIIQPQTNDPCNGRGNDGRMMIPRGFSLTGFARQFPSLQERWYVIGKLATDPLYPAVHEALQGSESPLLDVGCGMGVLAFYLRQMGWMPAITGVDYDARKIAIACKVATRYGGGLEFFQGDAGVGMPDHCGSVTVLDILQYMSADGRDEMLRGCAARVAGDGLMIIRTGFRDDSWRFRVTRFMDRMAVVARWMKTPLVNYPVREELSGLLEGEGLRGEFKPLWGGTPFNNWLGVFRRVGMGAPSIGQDGGP